MSKPNNAIDLTVVYEDVGPAGSRPASRSSRARSARGEPKRKPRANVVDALRMMLSLEPDNIPDHATAERVRITLALAQRQTRDLGLDR